MTKFQMALASIVTVLWAASLCVRVLLNNVVINFGVLDSVVLLVFGFIFGVGAVKKVIPNKSSDVKK